MQLQDVSIILRRDTSFPGDTLHAHSIYLVHINMRQTHCVFGRYDSKKRPKRDVFVIIYIYWLLYKEFLAYLYCLFTLFCNLGFRHITQGVALFCHDAQLQVELIDKLLVGRCANNHRDEIFGCFRVVGIGEHLADTPRAFEFA